MTISDVLIADIDECEEKSFNCRRFADCNNTIGSYKCVCRPGFTGNGTFCKGFILALLLSKEISMYTAFGKKVNRRQYRIEVPNINGS